MKRAGLSKRLVFGEDERVGKWIESRLNHPLDGYYRAIGLEQGDQLIGGVVYTNYSGGNIAANIAGDKGFITRRFIRAAFAYPFVQLKLRRLTVFVANRNAISQRFVESLGFQLESIMERAFKDDDARVYRMFNEDCKWLR